jgi:hypothetical protein
MLQCRHPCVLRSHVYVGMYLCHACVCGVYPCMQTSLCMHNPLTGINASTMRHCSGALTVSACALIIVGVGNSACSRHVVVHLTDILIVVLIQPATGAWSLRSRTVTRERSPGVCPRAPVALCRARWFTQQRKALLRCAGPRLPLHLSRDTLCMVLQRLLRLLLRIILLIII